MRNIIVIAAILATAGFWYYRRYVRGSSRNRATYDVPKEYFDLLDIEDLIAWFLKIKNEGKDLSGLSGIAIDLTKIDKYDDRLKNLSFDFTPPGPKNKDYPVILLLSFLNVATQELEPHREVVVLLAKSMSPALEENFGKSSIIVFE